MDQPTSHNRYHNPVYRHSCPDPFVLKFCGEYWCYSTGIQPDGRCFNILHSRDLVEWQPMGSALERLPEQTLPYPDLHYWAPEVVYDGGVFYMYYSVGDETHMQIRVATADHPAGPFVDSGRRLTDETFAIDAHVFVDDDGTRMLFYATDFLSHPRVGTGTAVVRLSDPFTFADTPRPVTRARYDWQIYDPDRKEKGGVRWHTLEGPFVLKNNGVYYQMFSGGNWQNASYGVGYGLARQLDQVDEWDQPCDGLETLPILRSDPVSGVLGPGHNSVVRGPDNLTKYCVYHRWQPETSERVMAIDRLRWEGERLLIDGPTNSPQPLPPAPDVAGFESFILPDTAGAQLMENRLHLAAGHSASCRFEPSGFVLEVSLRSTAPHAAQITWLSFFYADQPAATISLHPETNTLQVETTAQVDRLSLPAAFDLSVYHLLRIEHRTDELQICLDGVVFCARLPLTGPIDSVRLSSSAGSAEFAGFALTAL